MASVQINKTYKTVGGWNAIVVWVSNITHLCYVVHQPNVPGKESPPIAHNKYTGKPISLLSVNEPPVFDANHPSDLVIPIE